MEIYTFTIIDEQYLLYSDNIDNINYYVVTIYDIAKIK